MVTEEAKGEKQYLAESWRINTFSPSELDEAQHKLPDKQISLFENSLKVR